ncbi:MAG: hypothetical protein FIA95_10290 [Gemmatimonadetes bacterium]|nr:hypothetical protein [Gemmatimonadota bacterium]
MKRRLLLAVAALGAAACSPGASNADAPPSGAAGAPVTADTLTRRQRDSIFSTLPIPGAGKIGDAMRAADKINARTRAIDSIR